MTGCRRARAATSATSGCAGRWRKRGSTTRCAPFPSTLEGACLLHLGRKSEALMPRDPRGEAEVTQWLVSALNSVEMVTVPWWFVKVSGASENPLHDWMMQRFDKLERVLEGR